MLASVGSATYTNGPQLRFAGAVDVLRLESARGHPLPRFLAVQSSLGHRPV